VEVGPSEIRIIQVDAHGPRFVHKCLVQDCILEPRARHKGLFQMRISQVCERKVAVRKVASSDSRLTKIKAPMLLIVCRDGGSIHAFASLEDSQRCLDIGCKPPHRLPFKPGFPMSVLPDVGCQYLYYCPVIVL